MAATVFTPGTVITSQFLNDLQAQITNRRVYVFDYLTAAQQVDVLARTETLDTAGAIRNALSALKAIGGGELVFNYGFYRIDSSIVVDFDACYFVGSGPRASVIRKHHDTGDGITVQHATSPGTAYVNGFGMFNISLRATVDTNTGALLTLNKAQMVHLNSLQLEDNFGGIQVLGGLQHYYNNLHILSARQSGNAAWSGVKTGSYFAKFGRSSDGQGPSEIFCTNFNWRRSDPVNYVEHGLIVNAVDGLWLSNGHIMGVSQDDMRVEPITGVEQITGIKLSNVWLDNNCTNGLHILGDTSTSFGVIELSGCRFLTPSNIGIFVEITAVSFEGVRMSGGSLNKAGNYGVLLRAGSRHLFSGVEFAACNTNAVAASGGIVVDQGANKVLVSGCHFSQTTLGVTATSMIGVRVNVFASAQVQVTGSQFDLTALDISDSSTVDTNSYSNNTTTKAATATSISGTSLVISEIGDEAYVTAGLNFDNMTGRWNGRLVTLVFAGTSTVTHGLGGIRLSGSVNFVAKAGDTLTLRYNAGLGRWIETSRMVS
jgi:hypothetical protein